jgi:hypothetical protein
MRRKKGRRAKYSQTALRLKPNQAKNRDQVAWGVEERKCTGSLRETESNDAEIGTDAKVNRRGKK